MWYNNTVPHSALLLVASVFDFVFPVLNPRVKEDPVMNAVLLATQINRRLTELLHPQAPS